MTHSSLTATKPSQISSIDELTRIFNTTLIASKASNSKDFSKDLYALVESPAFRAILCAIRQLSNDEEISLKEAAQQVIETFRKADSLWTDYIFQEGIDRIKKQSH
ncbi:MAG: hypothetical protein A3K03_00330 [Bdellovibrionales bacterium RIFOXYD1_FULL_44_7]|nr:MAG: hypothetical protein A3K03_00330 [Bdellovibrionales bacterium RIFOXYD1_FULL_44_7]